MIWEFLQAGGWPMAPIVVCSVLSLALLMERAFYWLILWLHRDDALREAIISLRVDPRDLRDAKDPLCQALSVLASRPDDATPALAEADRLVAESKRTLPIIFVIATVSTSLGLLGTVLGVAMAFQRSAGSPNMVALTSALSVALNTTILGLLVYLPTYVGASLSQMASNRLSFQLEQGLNVLHARLRERGEVEVEPL